MEKLKEKIDKSGYKLSYLADQLGISRFSLRNKLNEKSQFKMSEIKKLAILLKIPNNEISLYFFSD